MANVNSKKSNSMYWLTAFTFIISNISFFGQAKIIDLPYVYKKGMKIESLVGGRESYHSGEYNYVVGINCNDQGCKCTGSIIDARFIITAAHCVFGNVSFKYDSINIIAGTDDISDHQDPRRIEMNVDKAYIPREYNRTKDLNYEYDVAVLRLRKSFDQESNLKKLRLPLNLDPMLVGKKAVFSGFGASKVSHVDRRTGWMIFYHNTKLRSAEVTILANDRCSDPFVSDTNFCGTMVKEPTNHYGACDGDSGGPLVYEADVLVGVFTNSGNNCNSRLEFEVYQRVTSFISFIQNAMEDNTSKMLFKNY